MLRRVRLAACSAAEQLASLLTFRIYASPCAYQRIHTSTDLGLSCLLLCPFPRSMQLRISAPVSSLNPSSHPGLRFFVPALGLRRQKASGVPTSD